MPSPLTPRPSRRSLSPLPCGVSALGGEQDPRYRPDQLAAWEALSAPDRFDIRWFKGGHLFVRDEMPAVLAYVEAKAREVLAERAGSA